jgi:hypothetical protein
MTSFPSWLGLTRVCLIAVGALAPITTPPILGDAVAKLPLLSPGGHQKTGYYIEQHYHLAS